MCKESEPDRLFKILDSGLQLHKGVSLASNVLLVQVLGFKHPHLQHPLVSASQRSHKDNTCLGAWVFFLFFRLCVL